MTLNKTTHKNIMIEILTALFMDTEIGPQIAFKGGTAMMLFYDLNRFSVDLDFDILKVEEKDSLYEKLKDKLSGFGDLKEADKKFGGLFFSLSYRGKLANAENLKLDFNTRLFGSSYEQLDYLGIPMKVMVKEDLMAHKMCAMFERGANTSRDLFDVNFFLKAHLQPNREIILTRTGLSYTGLLEKLLGVVKENEESQILESLGEVLQDEKQKVWVKTKLRQELTLQLKIAMEGERID